MNRTRLIAIALLAAACTAHTQEDAALLRQKTAAHIDRLIDQASGIVGYAALDLVSGEALGRNQDLVFPQASAIKIPILIEVHRQAAAGAITLTQRLPVTAALQVGGSGVAQHFGDGTSALSVGDLCVLMITLSDNTATNMLIDLVGMERINATLSTLGLTQTAVRRVMMDARASAQNRENTSTPSEAARLMALLHQGKVVTPELSADVLRVLAIGKGGAFAAAFPDSVRVAWKPGGIAGVETVWALVQLPERPFACAVMEKFDSAGEAGDIQREIARTLFDYYWRLGNASRYGTFVDPALKSQKKQ